MVRHRSLDTLRAWRVSGDEIFDVLSGLWKGVRADFGSHAGEIAGAEGDLRVRLRCFTGFDGCRLWGWFGVLRNKPNFFGLGLDRGFRFFLTALLLEFAEVIQVAREGSVGGGVITQH